MNNVVIVSDEQWRNSAVHIHISILPQTPLPSRLSQSSEQSCVCYAEGPGWLSMNCCFKHRNGIWDFGVLTAQMRRGCLKGLGYLFQANWTERKEAQTQLPASRGAHRSP